MRAVTPSEIAGALLQGVLEAQALLVAEHLLWRRLADINDGLTPQVALCANVR